MLERSRTGDTYIHNADDLQLEADGLNLVRMDIHLLIRASYLEIASCMSAETCSRPVCRARGHDFYM